MNQCKNICRIDYNVSGLNGPNTPDWPKCSTCGVKINIEDKIWCPCCHGRLSYARVKLGKGEGKLVKA